MAADGSVGSAGARPSMAMWPLAVQNGFSVAAAPAGRSALPGAKAKVTGVTGLGAAGGAGWVGAAAAFGGAAGAGTRAVACCMAGAGTAGGLGFAQ